VQGTLQLNNGQSVLKLTTATYWRPSGVNIHRFKDAKESDAWGVSPDRGLEVQLTDAENEARLESRRARDLVRREGEAPKPAPDRQLDKAIEVIKAKISEAVRDRAA
jgi:carboxyl-terminal processing protease